MSNKKSRAAQSKSNWWSSDIKEGDLIKLPWADLTSYYIWKNLAVLYPDIHLDMQPKTYMQIIYVGLLGTSFPRNLTLQLKAMTQFGKILEFRILEGTHHTNFLRTYRNSLVS